MPPTGITIAAPTTDVPIGNDAARRLYELQAVETILWRLGPGPP